VGHAQSGILTKSAGYKPGHHKDKDKRNGDEKELDSMLDSFYRFGSKIADNDKGAGEDGFADKYDWKPFSPS